MTRRQVEIHNGSEVQIVTILADEEQWQMIEYVSTLFELSGVRVNFKVLGDVE